MKSEKISSKMVDSLKQAFDLEFGSIYRNRYEEMSCTLWLLPAVVVDLIKKYDGTFRGECMFHWTTEVGGQVSAFEDFIMLQGLIHFSFFSMQGQFLGKIVYPPHGLWVHKVGREGDAFSVFGCLNFDDPDACVWFPFTPKLENQFDVDQKCVRTQDLKARVDLARDAWSKNVLVEVRGGEVSDYDYSDELIWNVVDDICFFFRENQLTWLNLDTFDLSTPLTTKWKKPDTFVSLSCSTQGSVVCALHTTNETEILVFR